MAAVTKRGVDRDPARSRREGFHDFPHHDRPVRAGRRLAAGQHLLDIRCIAIRLVFLVFLVKLPRVFARVTRTAARLFGQRIGHGKV